MINARRLRDDLKRMLKRLEDDLRQRATSVEAMQTALQHEYTAAKEAGRAGEAFEVWREGMLTQAGAAWLLSGVFVRFLEDNGLVQEALLSSPGDRRDEASERQMRYFQRRPTDSDRDYLYDVFRAVQTLPADAAQGQVWRSIIELLDSHGVQNDFVSVTDVPRQTFAKHPWSIGGGGIADIKSLIEAHSS